MLRTALRGLALLVVAVACRDGPSGPDGIPRPAAPLPMASSEALTAINDLQNDPLVGLLLEKVPDSHAARELYASFLAASRVTGSGERLVVTRISSAPGGGVSETTAAEQEIYRAALVVVLSEVRTLLAVPSEQRRLEP